MCAVERRQPACRSLNRWTSMNRAAVSECRIRRRPADTAPADTDPEDTDPGDIAPETGRPRRPKTPTMRTVFSIDSFRRPRLSLRLHLSLHPFLLTNPESFPQNELSNFTGPGLRQRLLAKVDYARQFKPSEPGIQEFKQLIRG